MSCAPHHPSPSIANMCGPSVTGRGVFSESTNGYPKASWLIELSGGWKTTVSRFRRSARSRNRKIAGSDDTNKPSYKIAREYMIRLEREDLEDQDKLRMLAQATSSQNKIYKPDEFRARFQHLFDA